MLILNLPDDSPKANEEHIPENRETKRMRFKGTIMLCDDSSDLIHKEIVNGIEFPSLSNSKHR
jgi:hypothetical protein